MASPANRSRTQHTSTKDMVDASFVAPPATPSPRLICIGLPLLELHADVPAKAMEKFDIQPNTAVQATETHTRLLRALLFGKPITIDGHSVGPASFTCGGGCAALAARTVRALSLANEQGSIANEQESKIEVFLLGGVGKDEVAQQLRELFAKDDIGVLFSDTEAELTGWRVQCRVISSRSRLGVDGLGAPPGSEPSDFEKNSTGPQQLGSVTYTGASREYQLDHLRFKVWEDVEFSHLVYIDAHFVTTSLDCARIVGEHCAKMGKTFCINLSTRYLCGFFSDRILQLIPYADYVFGCESEFMELAQAGGPRDESGTTLEDAVTWLAKLPRADGNHARRRRVVATAGTKPVVVASTWRGFGVKVQRFPVPPVRIGKFVCKEGAGDAFAGGFLYALLKDADLDSCIQMALFAAHHSVQRTTPAFVFKDRPTIVSSGSANQE